MLGAWDQKWHVLLCVTASLLAPIESKDRTIRTRNRLIKIAPIQLRSNFEYQGCVDDLVASDLDGDKKVSEEEYVQFISTRSRGGIDAEDYGDLPFPLISNFVYGSCFCSFVSKDPTCCVGDNAGISLAIDESSIIEQNLITVCRTANDAIESQIGTFPPTKAPIAPITEEPTASPTGEPTPGVTEDPTASPIASPTEAPIAATTEAPTASPTAIASGTPTFVTSSPTLAPTNATASPTETVSGIPTFVTSSPTLVPTNATEAPTVSASDTPTGALTLSPTLSPIVAPTDIPTGTGGLVCVSFQYGIENDEGLDAEEISSGVNNTFKEDLIDATEEIVAQILNATQETRALRTNDDHDWTSAEGHRLLGVISLSEYGLGERNKNLRKRAATTSETRRLAILSPDFPPEISRVTDNQYCLGTDESTLCSIVDSTVCVVLEEGDDASVVRDQLLDGIRTAFEDDSFEEVLSGEN